MKFLVWLRKKLKQSYECDCPKHRKQNRSILGLVGAYIGVATSLSGLEGIDEKKYCSICHPLRNYYD